MSLLENNPVLLALFETKVTEDIAGNAVRLRSGITKLNAEKLYRITLSKKPESVLEIGMAHGISTAAMLTATTRNSYGSVTSIDPYQSSEWKGAGTRLVDRLGLKSSHQLIEDVDFHALPDLLRQKRYYEMAYVDGNHSFECVFLDFFYIDRLVQVGGLVGFNDCGLPAIRKVIKYILAHTSYVEIHRSEDSWMKVKRLKFWEHPDRWFLKTKNAETGWRSFKNF